MSSSFSSSSSTLLGFSCLRSALLLLSSSLLAVHAFVIGGSRVDRSVFVFGCYLRCLGRAFIVLRGHTLYHSIHFLALVELVVNLKFPSL